MAVESHPCIYGAKILTLLLECVTQQTPEPQGTTLNPMAMATDMDMDLPLPLAPHFTHPTNTITSPKPTNALPDLCCSGERVVSEIFRGADDRIPRGASIDADASQGQLREVNGVQEALNVQPIEGGANRHCILQQIILQPRVVGARLVREVFSTAESILEWNGG